MRITLSFARLLWRDELLLRANPRRRLGDAPLIFPRMLAEEEGQVLAFAQGEVLVQVLMQTFERGDTKVLSFDSAQPVFGFGEVRHPRIWRGDDQLPAGIHQP